MAKRRNNAVQSLIGFERFTRFGVKTDKAEIAFFSVEPTNISVLSGANIDTKICYLMMLLSIVPDLEIIARDSCECFDSNKIYVKERLEISAMHSLGYPDCSYTLYWDNGISATPEDSLTVLTL